MQFSDMVTRVGELINQGVSDDTKTVTNTEVKAWLNMGYRRCRNKVIATNQDFYVRLSKADLVEDQEMYSLPDDCRKLYKVEVGYTTSTDRELARRVLLNAENDPDTTYSVAQPYYYVMGNQIGLMPAPESAVTDGLWLWYIEDKDDLSGASDEASLPVGYEDLPIMYAVSKAKAKLGLTEESSMVLQEFEQGMEIMVDELSPRDIGENDHVIVREFDF